MVARSADAAQQLDVPLRTYTLYVGKMAEAQKLYTELGFLALKKVATTRTRDTARS